jgi:hypothetical protein
MTEGQEQQEVNAGDESEPEQVDGQDITDEDFGKMKMEMFKKKCRDMLKPPAHEEPPVKIREIMKPDDFY